MSGQLYCSCLVSCTAHDRTAILLMSGQFYCSCNEQLCCSHLEIYTAPVCTGILHAPLNSSTSHNRAVTLFLSELSCFVPFVSHFHCLLHSFVLGSSRGPDHTI